MDMDSDIIESIENFGSSLIEYILREHNGMDRTREELHAFVDKLNWRSIDTYDLIHKLEVLRNFDEDTFIKEREFLNKYVNEHESTLVQYIEDLIKDRESEIDIYNWEKKVLQRYLAMTQPKL